MAALPLPAVNPPGGSVDVMGGLPQFAANGNAFAAQQQLATTPAPAPAPAPAAAPAPNALPAYDPNTTMPAPRSNPALSPMGNLVDPYSQTAPMQKQLNVLAGQVNPGVTGAIKNFLFNPIGGPAATDYNTSTQAASVYSNPDAMKYFSAHPDLMSAATHDPVNFAMKLGPILEAHAAEQAGTHQPGPPAVHQTPDGPMLKDNPNGAKTNAMANAFGVDHNTANIMANPYAYTTKEWVKAALASGITNNQLEMMWGMQHYLSPSEQAKADVSNVANAQTAPNAAPLSPAQERLIQVKRLESGVDVPMISLPPQASQK
jgi:hypothetical protein